MIKLEKPYIITVDPATVVFHPDNPNTHEGSSFNELIATMKKNGLAQLPTVRMLPGGIPQTIDGEGRVRAARILGWKEIDLVNRGFIPDDVAIALMHIANSTRSFDFIARAKGLALLNRTGMTMNELVEQFQGDLPTSRRIFDEVAIGNFPSDILDKIDHDLKTNPDSIWKISMLRELLPLRIEVKHHKQTQNGVAEYDYKEVRAMIKRIESGDVISLTDLVKQVARRRVQMSEKLLDQSIQHRVKEELEQAKTQLEDTFQNDLVGIKAAQKKEYEEKVKILQERVDALQEQYNQALQDISKRPRMVEEKERELFQQTELLRSERESLESLKRKQQFDIHVATEKIKKEQEAIFKKKLEEERRKDSDQLEQLKQQLEANFAEKDASMKLQATTTFQAVVAKFIKQLAELYQFELMIMDPGFLNGFDLLSQSELLALSAQLITTMRQTQIVQNALKDLAQERDH